MTGTRCYFPREKKIKIDCWHFLRVFFKKYIRNISSSWLRIKPHITTECIWNFRMFVPSGIFIMLLWDQRASTHFALSLFRIHTQNSYSIELIHCIHIRVEWFWTSMRKLVWVWFLRYTLASLLFQHKTFEKCACRFDISFLWFLFFFLLSFFTSFNGRREELTYLVVSVFPNFIHGHRFSISVHAISINRFSQQFIKFNWFG